MKKLLITGLLALIAFAPLSAQMKNVNKVIYSYIESDKLAQKLDEAKILIDEGLQDEKAASKAKSWYAKAMVYAEIAKSKEAAIQQLAPDAAQVTREAIDKVYELEGKEDGPYGGKLFFVKQQVRNELFNRGVAANSEQDYEKAYEAFKSAAEFSPSDTLATKYAAIFAQQTGRTDEALAMYKQLIDNPDYNKDDVYQNSAQIMALRVQEKQNAIYEMKDQDADKAKIEAAEKEMEEYRDKTHEFVKEGLKKHPNNLLMVSLNVDYHNNKGEYEEAVESMKKVVELNPDNADYRAQLGGLYYSGTKDEEKAIAAYEKAYEIDPNNYGANEGLGVIYFNRGAKMLNGLSTEIYQNKESAEMKKITSSFKKALPYLEKAHEVDPEETQPLNPLRTIYREFGMSEKEKAMNEKIIKSLE